MKNPATVTTNQSLSETRRKLECQPHNPQHQPLLLRALVQVIRLCLFPFRLLALFFSWRGLSKKLVFLLSALLASAGLIGGCLYFFSKPASAAWMDENWLYRKPTAVTNNTTQETNVYIVLTLDTSDTANVRADSELGKGSTFHVMVPVDDSS